MTSRMTSDVGLTSEIVDELHNDVNNAEPETSHSDT